MRTTPTNIKQFPEQNNNIDNTAWESAIKNETENGTSCLVYIRPANLSDKIGLWEKGKV